MALFQRPLVSNFPVNVQKQEVSFHSSLCVKKSETICSVSPCLFNPLALGCAGRQNNGNRKTKKLLLDLTDMEVSDSLKGVAC